MNDREHAKTVAVTAETLTASRLATHLACDLAVLVRVEVEAAAWRRAEQLRRPAREISLLVAAAASLVLALALLSWAALHALDTTARAWLAALLVGAAWLILAGLLFVRGRRDLRTWRTDHPQADHPQARTEAEADARTSIEALFDLLAGELARHEEQRLARAAGHELKTVEQELGAKATVLETEAHEIDDRAASALQDLVEIVTLPGRAGIDALRRLLP
jgi:Putative Actinobacterial Holin-X, holin superfamily III